VYTDSVVDGGHPVLNATSQTGIHVIIYHLVFQKVRIFGDRDRRRLACEVVRDRRRDLAKPTHMRSRPFRVMWRYLNIAGGFIGGN